MALTLKQHAARENKLTASRVACLMSGDEKKILALWSEMIGDPDFVPEDLSGVWPVRLGEATEQLNLDWFERKYGKVACRGQVVTMANPEWAAATLDGRAVDRGFIPVEAKNVGGREPLETIVERYQPQLHWQMIVTGAKESALSVIMGANEPIVEFIPFNAEYAAELMRRAEQFMECVFNLTPPVALAPVAAPAIVVKEYDMADDKNWKRYAMSWLQCAGAAKTAKECEAELKKIVPADAMRCYGAGVEIKRNRAGSLSLKEVRP